MKKIIMLTGGGDSTNIMYNGLKDQFDISSVIIEEPISKKKLIKGRIKRLGYITVFGQLIFQLTVSKILNNLSKNRINEIVRDTNIDMSPVPDEVVKNFTSVNSKACREYLINENPDLIIVNGTRIISKKVLGCTGATFINTHAGITPRYRGVHGGFWALANNDLEHCGVTVHLVDAGIDTGGVLLQSTITPTSKDNFSTYPYLQTAAGVELMKKAVFDFVNGNLKTQSPLVNDSQLWYHPTVWFYLKKRLFNGVK